MWIKLPEHIYKLTNQYDFCLSKCGWTKGYLIRDNLSFYFKYKPGIPNSTKVYLICG